MFNSSKQMLAFHGDQIAILGKARTEMKNRRNSNRDRLKKGLAKNENPQPIGCHTQGSYAMHTMVQDPDLDYDIDDGAYFKATDLVGAQGAPMSALAVRKMVCDALTDDKFKKQPEVRKNCVRVYYDAGYHVDVPAYRRIETTSAWDGKVTYSYELAGPDWRISDAKNVTTWFRKVNKELSPDLGEGQFRRTVRYLKKFSKSRASWKSKNPSGFAITKLAEECFVAKLNRDDEALRDTMQAIANRLAAKKEIAHPVVDELLVSADDPRSNHFKDRLDEAVNTLAVLDDASCTHEQAMSAWDKVFYTDWFSQQPPEQGGKGGEPASPVNKSGGGTYAK
ncbi:hypothetical protein EB810_13700 [Altererythrobacter sp. FM1]|uniref:cyclic GMP-AMP synthase DncV-like nucleotidyltransferase n=1 Tax=Tsuneonella flava TaxID=2055955 RepID=UPI000C801EAA|nr:hypothetical protein [Tsuneonella flava]ROT94121.1 hypothetical protein EB810_13700 [Altererythrobacter sp. FM1]